MFTFFSMFKSLMNYLICSMLFVCSISLFSACSVARAYDKKYRIGSSGILSYSNSIVGEPIG